VNRPLPSGARANAADALGQLVSPIAPTVPTTFVRGSLILLGAQAAEVHWQPVVQTVDINPLERSKVWSLARRTQFNWLTGDAPRLFSYQSMTPVGSLAFWAAHERRGNAHQVWPHWHERVRSRLCLETGH
jgi:hypothetical protein